jgi:hypothetical protein
MRIIHTYKICNLCKRELSIEEFSYLESKDTYLGSCRECVNQKKNKTGKKKRKNIVKQSWLNSYITLSNGEKVLTNKIKECDKQKFIDEGFGFIFLGYDPKGKSVL